MAITGTTDLGNGILAVTVNHDPTVVATDAPAGSLIIASDGTWYHKDVSGSNVNVTAVTLGGGASGFSGFSSQSGTSGFSGKSGTSGTSGLGLSGYSGISGWSGKGSSGYSGISGYSSIGTSGYSGVSGTSGAGFSGFSGPSGTSGFSGTSGYSGTFSGTSGFSGPSGAGQSGFSGFSGSIGPVSIFQTAVASGNSTRVNNATPTDDVDLQIPLAANTQYFFHSQLHFTQNFTNNFTNLRLWFHYTGTASNVQINFFGSNTADTSLMYQTQFNMGFAFGGLLFQTTNATFLWGFDINGSFTTSTAGTLTLQWAQGTSQPTTTTLDIGSYIEARQNMGALSGASGTSGFSSVSGFSGISIDIVKDPLMLTLFG